MGIPAKADILTEEYPPVADLLKRIRGVFDLRKERRDRWEHYYIVRMYVKVMESFRR